MALVLLAWVDSDNKASQLLIDASPSRSHTATAQVTEHPVEKGAPATDYIRPMPRRLSIEGFITNTPIGAPPVVTEVAAINAAGQVAASLPSASDVGGGAGVDAEVTTVTITPLTTYNTYIRGPRPPEQVTALDFLEDFDRVRTSFSALVDAVLHGCLFTIITSLTDYQNMAALSMTVTEDKHSVNALNFTMEFQELRIVTTQVVLVPARSAKQNMGTKTPAAADEATKGKVLQSTASAIIFGPAQ